MSKIQVILLIIVKYDVTCKSSVCSLLNLQCIRKHSQKTRLQTASGKNAVQWQRAEIIKRQNKLSKRMKKDVSLWLPLLVTSSKSGNNVLPATCKLAAWPVLVHIALQALPYLHIFAVPLGIGR